MDAYGTYALRNIVGEEVAATFRDTEDLSPRALFADITQCTRAQTQFGERYLGVLRSPHSRARTAHSLFFLGGGEKEKIVRSTNRERNNRARQS